MRGKFNGKRKVAVDVDDVLGIFMAEWIKFHNSRFGTNLKEEEIFSMALWKVLGLREGEEVPYLISFYESGKLRELSPIYQSQEAVSILSGNNNYLGVVTSRDLTWEETTLSWLNKHFPNCFSDVHFAVNPYAKNPMWKNGHARKSEICLREGYDFIIDDSLETAIDCAEKGMGVLLFGDYMWNKRESLPENIFRVRNWKEVLRYLER